VQVRLRVRRTVGDVIQRGVSLHHLSEHVALDAHETGGCLRHFDKIVAVGVAAYPLGAMTDRIKWVFGIAILELLLGVPAGRPSAGQLSSFTGYTPAVTSRSINSRRQTDCGVKVMSESIQNGWVRVSWDRNLITILLRKRVIRLAAALRRTEAAVENRIHVLKHRTTSAIRGSAI